MNRALSPIRVMLATVLCAIAILFAVEAKVAGYHPDPGFASGIHAAKAWPADSERATAALPPEAKQTAVLSFGLLLTVVLTSSIYLRHSRPAPLPVRAALDSAQVHLSRRPPPAL